MDLKIWLVTKGRSVTDFADLLGYSRRHIDALVNGRSRVSPRLAKTITLWTDGAVTKEDLDKRYDLTAHKSKKEKG